MTPLEKRLRRKYTRSKWQHAYLHVGHQWFGIGVRTDRKIIARLRDCLAIALARIVEEEGR